MLCYGWVKAAGSIKSETMGMDVISIYVFSYNFHKQVTHKRF